MFAHLPLSRFQHKRVQHLHFTHDTVFTLSGAHGQVLVWGLRQEGGLVRREKQTVSHQQRVALWRECFAALTRVPRVAHNEQFVCRLWA